jgi:hypothetical protein
MAFSIEATRFHLSGRSKFTTLASNAMSSLATFGTLGFFAAAAAGRSGFF